MLRLIRPLPILLLLAAATAAAGADAALPKPDVPDPFGLGDRLALIDYLKNQLHATVAEGATYDDLVKQYWDIVDKPKRDAEAAKEDQVQELRERLKHDFNITTEVSDPAALQAMIDEAAAKATLHGDHEPDHAGDAPGPVVATPDPASAAGGMPSADDQPHPGSGPQELTGGVAIGDGSIATLLLPQGAGYIAGDEAKAVVADHWGNPITCNLQGLIVPTAMDVMGRPPPPHRADRWAIVVSWSPTPLPVPFKYVDNLLIQDLENRTSRQGYERHRAGRSYGSVTGFPEAPAMTQTDGQPTILTWGMQITFEISTWPGGEISEYPGQFKDLGLSPGQLLYVGPADVNENVLNYHAFVAAPAGILGLTGFCDLEQLAEMSARCKTIASEVSFAPSALVAPPKSTLPPPPPVIHRGSGFATPDGLPPNTP